MNEFPRTEVGGLSMPRMIIGTNWFLGFSHCSVAKDQVIKAQHADYRSIADVLEVFLRAGVDAIMFPSPSPIIARAAAEAEQRVGRSMIRITTPGIEASAQTAATGFDEGAVAATLDADAELGTSICMPHSSVTDAMLDKCTGQLRCMDRICEMIRERGMIPGLSTHAPETIVYADKTALDVETYISILNVAGFLMHWEADWTMNTIHRAQKPVTVIKPMAAGRVPPLEALTFIWNAIREIDMVTVGTTSPDEAAELIEMSLRLFDGRPAVLHLQQTRSKKSGMALDV